MLSSKKEKHAKNFEISLSKVLSTYDHPALNKIEVKKSIISNFSDIFLALHREVNDPIDSFIEVLDIIGNFSMIFAESLKEEQANL